MKLKNAICLMLLFSLGVFNLKAQDRYSGSEHYMIKKEYTKLEKKYDTLLIYERTCSACIEGIVATFYFFYRDKHGSYLKVYTKDLSARKVSRVGMIKNINVKKVLDYAIQNFDSLSMISGTRDLYSEYEAMNDTNHNNKNIVKSGFEDGPRTYCYLKLGDKSMSNCLYGITEIKEYFTVKPLIGNFLTLIHEAYSKYNKNEIIDMN